MSKQAAVLPRAPVRDGLRSRITFERLRSLQEFLIFELAFLAAYTYAMAVSSNAGAPFWLPDSVLLAALVLSQPRSWPIYVCGTLPIRLLAAVPADTPSWF